MRHRTTAPRQASGLHVECLEPRTVLSASIGAMPTNYDALQVFVARDEVVHDTGRNSSPMVSEYIGRHFEDGRVAYDGGHSAWMLEMPNRGPLFGSFQPSMRVAYVIILVDRGHGPATDVNESDVPPPLRAQDGASGDAQPSLAISNQPDPHFGDRPSPPPRFISTPSFASLASAVVPATNNGSTETTTITARDSVFQAYSTDDLLLALDLDGELDEEDDDALDVQSEEDEADELGLSNDSAIALLDDHSEAAVDSLERERAAVDAVLSELQDIEPAPPVDGESPVITTGDDGASAVPMESVTDAAAQATQATNDAASAGMVWLVPTGDANSSAWDLSGVFLSELPAAVRGSAEVEATLGIYQAFDVGTPEPMPATADAAPASTPAAAARPNVSAGNQTAKQSDQPS